MIFEYMGIESFVNSAVSMTQSLFDYAILWTSRA
jgi:hypothetical protein